MSAINLKDALFVPHSIKEIIEKAEEGDEVTIIGDVPKVYPFLAFQNELSIHIHSIITRVISTRVNVKEVDVSKVLPVCNRSDKSDLEVQEKPYCIIERRLTYYE